MATYEHTALQQYKDQNGDMHLLYPITKAENVDGLYGDAALTGVPTAPTAATGTNTTQVATTAFVQQELEDVKNSLGVLAAKDTITEAELDDTLKTKFNSIVSIAIGSSQPDESNANLWFGVTTPPGSSTSTSTPLDTNFLENSDFSENTNGLTTYSCSKSFYADPNYTETVDNWKLRGSTTRTAYLDVVDGGVKLYGAASNTSNSISLYQRVKFAIPELPSGKTWELVAECTVSNVVTNDKYDITLSIGDTEDNMGNGYATSFTSAGTYTIKYRSKYIDVDSDITSGMSEYYAEVVIHGGDGAELSESTEYSAIIESITLKLVEVDVA